jgi:hypothetical protein
MTTPTNAIISYSPSQIPEIDSEGLTDEQKAARLQEASATMFAAVFNSPDVTPGSKAAEIVEARKSKAIESALAALFATMN